MLVLFEGFGLLLLALWIFALFDVITTPEIDCRNLPKPAWILIVLLLPDVGSILWLIAGRPAAWARRPDLPYKGNSTRFPEYDRPGRAVAGNPDDDAEFLQSLRDRVEEQRRRAKDDTP